MNKKGAEGTTWTIIVIILALIALVVLVVGFTGGWGKLWSRITSFFGGSNVDSVVQACQMACSTGARYDYCTALRDVKFEDKTRNGKYNCRAMEEEDVGLSPCDFDNCLILKTLNSEKDTCKGLNASKCLTTAGCKVDDAGDCIKQ